MEVRKMMRYETNADRVRRGVPIFVTWSPDEKNNVLILRLHRSRRNDLIHELDKENKKFGARAMPNMDQDFVEMKVFNLFVRRTPHRQPVPGWVACDRPSGFTGNPPRDALPVIRSCVSMYGLFMRQVSHRQPVPGRVACDRSRVSRVGLFMGRAIAGNPS